WQRIARDRASQREGVIGTDPGDIGMTAFRAFRIHNDDAGYRAGIETMTADALSPGEVLVKVAYSSVNYKDALAGTGKGRILRRYPLNGGIDVAGHVVASTDPAFKEGDAVLCTGSGLSDTRGWRRAGRSRCRKVFRCARAWSWVPPASPRRWAFCTCRTTARRPRWARSPSPAPAAAWASSRSTSTAAPATRCTRSAARPTTSIS